MSLLAPRPRATHRPTKGIALPATEIAELADWEPPLYDGNPLQVVLTPMERNVLESLCEGKSNRMIARDWGVAEDTIKSHVRSLMAKIGSRDRTHAVALVYSGVVVVKAAEITVRRAPRVYCAETENEPTLAA